MAADGERLTREMIDTPSMWRASMLITDRSVEVVMHSPVVENSLIYRSLPLDGAAASPLAAIEEIVYDNPLLLCDFGKTDVLIDTDRFTLVPSEIDSDDTRIEIVSNFWPDPQLDVLAEDLPDGRTAILAAVDGGLLSFVQRTFPDARLHHSMWPLITYFLHKSKLGNTGKMYAHMSQDTVSIISFSREGLKVATRARFVTPDDAMYYILATAQTSGIDVRTDNLMLCGDPGVYKQLMPLINRYVGCVMPVIFPSSMFKAGKESLKAPFQLIVLPLCE